MEKPIVVQRAVWLLWASLVLSVPLYIYQTMEGIIEPSVLYISLLVLLLFAIVPAKVGQGREWARVVVLVASLFGWVSYPFMLDEFTMVEHLFMAVDSAITLPALYWLFRSDSSAWFKAMSPVKKS